MQRDISLLVKTAQLYHPPTLDSRHAPLSGTKFMHRKDSGGGGGVYRKNCIFPSSVLITLYVFYSFTLKLPLP